MTVYHRYKRREEKKNRQYTDSDRSTWLLLQGLGPPPRKTRDNLISITSTTRPSPRKRPHQLKCKWKQQVTTRVEWVYCSCDSDHIGTILQSVALIFSIERFHNGNWWFEPFDEKFHFKKTKNDPHSHPEKKRGLNEKMGLMFLK